MSRFRPVRALLYRYFWSTMFAKLFTIASLLVWLCQDYAAQASPPKLRQADIDISHFKASLRFDWEKRRASGRVEIWAQLLHSTQTVRLAAQALKVYGVTLAGGKKIAFETDSINHLLHLDLGKGYKAGHQLRITIFYETRHHNQSDPNAIGGSFGKGIRFMRPSATNPIRRKQLWSHSEILGTSCWLPCNTDPMDMATSEVSGVVDAGYSFVSNGELETKTPNADGTITFTYKANSPHFIFLTAFVAGQYTDLVQHKNGTDIHTYCYPDEVEAAKASTILFPDMLRFLESLTGYKYPFSHYSQVLVQDYPFPGLTGPHMLGIVSDNLADDYGTHQDFRYLWDGVAFNALASQWFGNILIPENVEDIWLAKGMAQYFEGLYTAEKNGTDEYYLWYQPWERGNVLGNWNNGVRHAIVPHHVSEPESFVTDGYAKYKGALVLRMLQMELGDSVCAAAIRSFIRENAHRPVSTKQFQKTIQQVSGRNMDWFFDQWIYHANHPQFMVTDSFYVESGQYVLNIKQAHHTDSSGKYPETLFFRGHMEVEIDGVTERIWIQPKKENQFTFLQKKRPNRVVVDLGNTWFCEFTMAKGWQEWMSIFLHCQNAANRSSAMAKLIDIAQDSFARPETKAEIVDALKKVVRSNAYWRLRLNALSQLRTLQTFPFEDDYKGLLISLVRNDKSWVRAAAITSLGQSADPSYAEMYMSCFGDTSDRVVSAAALALGKTKGPGAYEALVNLKQRPSWKGQSLMHCLAGLAQLGDKRAENIAIEALADLHSPRWFLGNTWDFPFVAVQTLSALGTTDRAIELLLQRFNQAMEAGQIEDIFYQVLLISTLGNAKGLAIFGELKAAFQHDTNAMQAVHAFESQLAEKQNKR